MATDRLGVASHADVVRFVTRTCVKLNKNVCVGG